MTVWRGITDSTFCAMSGNKLEALIVQHVVVYFNKEHFFLERGKHLYHRIIPTKLMVYFPYVNQK